MSEKKTEIPQREAKETPTNEKEALDDEATELGENEDLMNEQEEDRKSVV